MRQPIDPKEQTIAREGTLASDLLCGPMRLDEISLDQLADELIHLHGANARQKVVDEIMRAIRSHDVASAKRWDELGVTIDLRLAA